MTWAICAKSIKKGIKYVYIFGGGGVLRSVAYFLVECIKIINYICLEVLEFICDYFSLHVYSD